MTALLACDGCGNIAQDRGDDPTRDWWELSKGPAVNATGLISLATTFEYDEGDPDPVELDLDDPEPVRHFCSTGCLRVWLERIEETP